MKLKQLKITDVTYGCLLNACVKNDRMDLALILVDKMKQDNIALNTILYTTLIKGFSRANKLEEAVKIFDLMKAQPKALPNIISYNCIIDACIKGEDLTKALNLFSEMKMIYSPDLITYSTMIKGFCKQKDIKKGYEFLMLMQSSNIIPDEALINLLLESCYINNEVDIGVKIFELMISLKIRASNITYGIMIKVSYFFKPSINYECNRSMVEVETFQRHYQSWILCEQIKFNLD